MTLYMEQAVNGVSILLDSTVYLFLYFELFFFCLVGLRFRTSILLGKAVVGGLGVEARVWGLGSGFPVAFSIDPHPSIRIVPRHLMIRRVGAFFSWPDCESSGALFETSFHDYALYLVLCIRTAVFKTENVRTEIGSS